MRIILHPIAIIMALFSVSASLRATSLTCAQHLRLQFSAIVEPTIGFPVAEWAKKLLNARANAKTDQDILRLDAATMVIRGIRSPTEIAEAKQIIDNFFELLQSRYRAMTLTKEEAVFVLHKFNINSVDNGLCGSPLVVTLFPDENASQYLRYERQWRKAFEPPINAKPLDLGQRAPGIKKLGLRNRKWPLPRNAPR